MGKKITLGLWILLYSQAMAGFHGVCLDSYLRALPPCCLALVRDWNAMFSDLEIS